MTVSLRMGDWQLGVTPEGGVAVKKRGEVAGGDLTIGAESRKDDPIRIGINWRKRF